MCVCVCMCDHTCAPLGVSSRALGCGAAHTLHGRTKRGGEQNWLRVLRTQLHVHAARDQGVRVEDDLILCSGAQQRPGECGTAPRGPRRRECLRFQSPSDRIARTPLSTAGRSDPSRLQTPDGSVTPRRSAGGLGPGSIGHRRWTTCTQHQMDQGMVAAWRGSVRASGTRRAGGAGHCYLYVCPCIPSQQCQSCRLYSAQPRVVALPVP